MSSPFARLLVLLVVLTAPAVGSAFESCDFETPYLVHPGRQVWDFCLVRDAGQYHAFYHTIAQQTPSPANADTIWHAVSPDLTRWAAPVPVLTSGPDAGDAVAIWAPDVVFDAASGRWAMLYTGVGAGMVQRACLAWSDDLATWTKSPANPVFEPDSLTYHWAPTQAWSSFRDPFVFHDGVQWNMLSTAGLRLGGYPGYRQGIVHRAVSPDLVNWSDAGVFYAHDGTSGRTRDLESVQYVVRNGWHHLFFVEQDLAIDNHPTSHLVAASPAGWTMAARDVVDAGWAPEIKRFDGGTDTDVFARLAKGQDPRDGSWFVTMRSDSIRFTDGGQTATVVITDPLAAAWPVREGTASWSTFGENGVLRGESTLGVAGHGWLSTREDYGGPLSGSGSPGALWGDAATGRLESLPFTVTGGHLRLLLAGGYQPETCGVALIDADTGTELARIHANNSTRFAERLWDLGPWLGRSLRLAVIDAGTGPGAWIAVDGIEQRPGDLAGTGDAPARGLLTGAVQAAPNPFNPRTSIRFTPGRGGVCRVDIFDVAGRRVWQSVPQNAAPQVPMSIVWDGRNLQGRAAGSGTYLAQVSLDGAAAGRVRLVLLK